MKRKLFTSILCALSVSLMCACGGEATNTNNTGSGKESTVTEKEKQTSEYAYDFATDSKNRKIYDVRYLPRLELYNININSKAYCHYVMDSNGNTLMKPQGEFKESDFHKYIYMGSNENVVVIDAKTYEDVTPDAVQEGGVGNIHFINGDTLFTNKGAYDLVSGKTLWSDIELDIYRPLFRSDTILFFLTDMDEVEICNYKTGKIITENLNDEYTNFQLNGASYFCGKINNIVKVYDKDGQYVTEFTIPDGYDLAYTAFPGAHFVFDKNNPDELLVTDIYGNVVREGIQSSLDNNVYINDYVIVKGKGKAGMLDKDMNWVIPQEDSEYDDIFRYGYQLYELSKPDDTYYFYNVDTGATIQINDHDYRVPYSIAGNKLIRYDNKMHSADTFELVDIEYKEGYTYEQISLSTFAEYYEDESKQVTIYDSNGNVVKKIDLDEGEVFYVGAGNSIVTYHKEKGFELNTF